MQVSPANASALRTAHIRTTLTLLEPGVKWTTAPCLRSGRSTVGMISGNNNNGEEPFSRGVALTTNHMVIIELVKQDL